jgi:hypothetical protein
MPNHTLLNTTPDTDSRSVRGRRTLGDVVVLVFAPFVAVGYHLTVFVLKVVGRAGGRSDSI